MALGWKKPKEHIPIEIEKYPDMKLVPLGEDMGYELDRYHGGGGTVVVPKGVVHIAPYAFEATEVSEVFLPEGITKIERNTFCGCRKLRRVRLPEGLVQIGECSAETSNGAAEAGAFSECTSLEQVEFPDSVQFIGYMAFRGCTSLKEVKFGRGLDAICDWAFMGCTALETLTLPDGLHPHMMRGAFEGCTSLKRVYIGGAAVGQEAFRGCTSLEEVSFLGDAGNAAFCGCTSLKRVNFLPPVLSEDGRDSIHPQFKFCGYTIGCQAFERCTSLERITVAGSVTSVLFDAFRGCTSLKEVTFEEGPLQLRGTVFNGCTALERVSLPDGTKELSGGVFLGCTALKRVEVPAGCLIDADTILTDSSFPEACEVVPKGGAAAGEFTVEGGVLTGYAGAGGNIVIPRGVVAIGAGVFANRTKENALLSVLLSHAVREIGDGAFEGCDSLRHINFPSGMQRIGARAFFGCTALGDVRFCPPLAEIGKEAFSGCGTLTSLELPASLTELGAAAFSNCTSLEDVSLGEGALRLDRTFSGCTALEHIHISDSVTALEGGTFENCSSLGRIDLGDGISAFDASVFAGCTSLKEIRVGAYCTVTNEEELPEGCEVTRKGFFL